ncbi:hypothetical protein BHE74_00057520 [Ensete ventricosum]|nr:hypothetical protein BHE74_00057520 [Ensete ventricosum]
MVASYHRFQPRAKAVVDTNACCPSLRRLLLPSSTLLQRAQQRKDRCQHCDPCHFLLLPFLHHLSLVGTSTRGNNLDVDLARVVAHVLEQRQGVGLPSTWCNRSTSVLSTKIEHPFRLLTQQIPAAFSMLSTTSPSSSPLPSCLSNITVKALDTSLSDPSPSSSSTTQHCPTAPLPSLS